MGGSQLKPEFPPLLERDFHPFTIEQVRWSFVLAFRTSVTRKGIMEGLERVIARLDAVSVTGEIWLDGSFVTEKIDPQDVDMLIRVPSAVFDGSAEKRGAILWASDPDRWDTHSCDSYKWIEYQESHPLFADSERDRLYFTELFGKSWRGKTKGIAVLNLPVNL